MNKEQRKPGRSPVPTTLITGFLGVGKTTAIRHLLAEKPAGEVWAVLVNEFGPIGLDDVYLSAASDPKAGEKARDSGIAVRMIPGGCICCSANLTLSVAIKEILSRIRPDRLIIEPTGLGHPVGILDCLHGFETAGAIERRAVVCLVDPARLEEARVRQSQVFIDQTNLADILVATKTDLCDASALVAFDTFAAEFFPPKSAILRIAHGRLPAWVVDAPASSGRLALFPEAHSGHSQSGSEPRHGHGHGEHHHHSHQHEDSPDDLVATEPAPGQPVRLSAANDEAVVCGWLFHDSDRFDGDAIAALLRDPAGAGCSQLGQAERIKAAVRTPKGADRIERAGRQSTAAPIAFRGQSRIEAIFPACVFADGGRDAAFDAIEACLKSCLTSPAGAASAPVPSDPASGADSG
ncbi:CobW family GTP-binding protein [Fodinicurvata sp. EGI_FJ10296]|uniref:CobW family GTP-binding protein n=1 Tax=Fodinicurvata sp. EGI_FJ10296 TaxID=3231908 RepID=UPI003451209B